MSGGDMSSQVDHQQHGLSSDLLSPLSADRPGCVCTIHRTNCPHRATQLGTQPSSSDPQFFSQIFPESSQELSKMQKLDSKVSHLEMERNRAQLAYQQAQRSAALYRAAQAHSYNSRVPLISRLPPELLIYIFLFVQNTVVVAQVCSYWRSIALSTPRLWSSLHIHPSKGAQHLETLLSRSLDHPVDVCFCPVPPMPKPPVFLYSPFAQGQMTLSLPPIYTQQYHPEMALTPRVVSVLTPHTHRFRSFELHAIVPGTWLTLLPLITQPCPKLRNFHLYTTLPQDVAQIPFFSGHTPQLRNVQITGAFPISHPGLLRNLTILRLESIPKPYRPTTKQMAYVLRECPDLITLSMLDAGPVPGNTYVVGGLVVQEPMDQSDEVHLPNLRALAIRDTDHPSFIGIPTNGTTTQTASGGALWFFQNVRTPSLVSLHLMLSPHPSSPMHIAMGMHVPPRAPPVPLPSPALGPANMPVAAAMAPAMTVPATAAPTIFSVMEEKTKKILEAIPSLEQLQELYLWALHASSSHIKSFLRRTPALKNLETPLVKDPVQVLQLFSSKNANSTGHFHLHNTAGLSDDSVESRPETTLEVADASSSSTEFPETCKYLIDSIPPPSSHIGSFNQRPDENEIGPGAQVADTQTGKEHEQWLSPHLERIGIPYINGCEQSDLEAALMEVFSARSPHAYNSPATESEQEMKPICALKELLAPGGRPTYIREDVWKWIGEKAKIQTFCSREEGAVDMLFDQISREASRS